MCGVVACQMHEQLGDCLMRKDRSHRTDFWLELLAFGGVWRTDAGRGGREGVNCCGWTLLLGSTIISKSPRQKHAHYR